MRALYLIRHGEPAFPNGIKVCIGRTDLPLSEKGDGQMQRWKTYFSALPEMKAYTSPLKRCVMSASAAGFFKAVAEKDLAEADMGEWEGHAFSDIRKIWPGLYAERGEDLLRIAPPGGESLAHCGERAFRAVSAIRAEQSAGDLAFFSHSGVLKMLSAAFRGEDPKDHLRRVIPYGAAALFLETEDAVLPGPVILPGTAPVPDEKECEKILADAGTPERAVLHGRAVAEKALTICDLLERRGVFLNRETVRAGALLHDMGKGRKRHADWGAAALLEKGYASLAAIVGDHMVMPKDEERVSEKCVVFLADKLVKDDRETDLYARYHADTPPQKRPFVRGRYEQAVRIRRMILQE